MLEELLISNGLNKLYEYIKNDPENINKIKQTTGIDLSKKTYLTEEEIIKLQQIELARQFQIKMSNVHGWLLRNTGSIIALLIICLGFGIFYKLLNNELSIENPNVALITGYIGGYVTTILSFYFGSSKTEADKGKLNG